MNDMLMLGCVAFCAAFALSKGIYLNDTDLGNKIDGNPAVWTEEGIWGPLLEEWALGNHSRGKRVMRLPPADNAYVISERADDAEEEEKESKIAPGKIVNSSPNQHKPPGREVSETDLYLLSAIEKLVHRVDFMEKRLRRVEEMMYYVMAGNRVDQEPCRDNFTRVAASCYFFSTTPLDWKAANKHCKRLGAHLAELETVEENQDVIAHLQAAQQLRGRDFWTGGLNPGLLWIWSDSGRPVNVPGAAAADKKRGIPGEGRCLRVAYDAALRSYGLRGSECGSRSGYVCEAPESTASNEVARIGRSKGALGED